MPRTSTKKVPPTTDSDLGAFAMRQTAIVVLTDPRFPGEERDTGYRVEIESIYSNAAREAITGAVSRIKIVKEGNGNGTAKAEEVEHSFSETLPEQVIAVTKRWWKEGESTDTITLNGETMRATTENVRRVYEDPQFAWIQRKVQADYLSVAGFFGQQKTA